ncbi:MAG: FG-GAP-like repeat-containing protein, partial [Planctomycetes bacterium]|nr:FG-GAP-like repeat-containing protein [Planctomycetota bacterium]
MLALVAASLPAQPSVTPPVSPVAGSHSASTTSDVSATFSDPMNAATATTFTVHSSMRGKKAGAYSGGGTNTLTMNPTANFYPGEVVEVTLTNGLTDGSAQALTPPYTWRFRTAASSGIGYFTDYVTSLNNQADLSTCVALGDVNGDGDVDIAIGNRTQVGRIFVNNGSGSFSAGATFGTVTQETYALIFCDVDRDGDLDLVMGNYEQQNKIYLNNGTGSFSSSINFGTGSDRTAALATADVNNDGWPDIITVNYQQQSSVYINSGGTNFSAFIDFGDSNAAGGAVDIGDMNNDGWLDFVVGNTSTLSPTGQNYVYLNDGSGGSFIPIAIGPDSGSTEGVTIGDLDNDGDLDVAWVNLSGQTSYYYFNDGNGSSYTQGGILGGGTNARRVVACDIDADGDLDLVVARNDQISSVYVNGGGSFGTTRD